MRDQINENYQNSLSALQEMQEYEDFMENGEVMNEEFIDTLDDILESDQLVLEGDNSDSALLLTPETNIGIFENVKGSAYLTLFAEATDDTEEDNEDNGDAEEEGTAAGAALMFPQVKPGNSDKNEAVFVYEDGTICEDDIYETEEGYLCDEEGYEVIEAREGNADDADDYNGDAEDNGTADYDERHPQQDPREAEDEKDDEDDEAKEEAIDPSEKDDLQETLANLIESDSYIIRTHLDSEGWLINENSPYFEFIQESLLQQLEGICEAFDEGDSFFEYIESLVDASSLEESGMCLVPGAPLDEKRMSYQKLTRLQKYIKKAAETGKHPAKYFKAAVTKGSLKKNTAGGTPYWKLTKSGKKAVAKHIGKRAAQGGAIAGGATAVGIGAKKAVDKMRKDESAEIYEKSKLVGKGAKAAIKKFFMNTSHTMKKGKMIGKKMSKTPGKGFDKIYSKVKGPEVFTGGMRTRGKVAIGGAGAAAAGGIGLAARKAKKKQNESVELYEKAPAAKLVGKGLKAGIKKFFMKTGHAVKRGKVIGKKMSKTPGKGFDKVYSKAKGPEIFTGGMRTRGKVAIGGAGAAAAGGAALAAKRASDKAKNKPKAFSYENSPVNELLGPMGRGVGKLASAPIKVVKGIAGEVGKTVGNVQKDYRKYKTKKAKQNMKDTMQQDMDSFKLAKQRSKNAAKLGKLRKQYGKYLPQS